MNYWVVFMVTWIVLGFLLMGIVLIGQFVELINLAVREMGLKVIIIPFVIFGVPALVYLILRIIMCLSDGAGGFLLLVAFIWICYLGILALDLTYSLGEISYDLFNK